MASEAPFDAGVVFFGGTRPDGLLDEDTRDRVRAAAALYHSGRVNELLAIGGARAHRSTPGSQLMIEALESEGVPAARLNRDSSSYDSVTNWEAAAAFAKRKGLHSVLLISCATHVYRLSHLVSRSRLRIGYYAAPLDNTRQRSWPRRWATAQREAIAFIALRVVPRPWYESALSRVRSAK